MLSIKHTGSWVQKEKRMNKDDLRVTSVRFWGILITEVYLLG